MANTNVEELLDRIEADPDLATRMKEAASPEAIQEVLRSEGFDVTGEAVRDAALDRWSDQLSPEELDAIAGGMDTGVTLALAGVGLWFAACVLAGAV